MNRYTFIWKIRDENSAFVTLESHPIFEGSNNVRLLNGLLEVDVEGDINSHELTTVYSKVLADYLRVYSLDEDLEIRSVLECIEHYINGTKSVNYFAEPAYIKVLGPPIDIVISDSAGKTINDSKQERIDKRESLTTLLSKWWGYPGVELMYERLIGAKNSPTPLVNYYDVLEIATKSIGNRRKVATELKIEWNDIDELAKRANCGGLKEGRHVIGTGENGIRHASEEDLMKSKQNAMRIFENYLLYLERTIVEN